MHLVDLRQRGHITILMLTKMVPKTKNDVLNIILIPSKDQLLSCNDGGYRISAVLLVADLGFPRQGAPIYYFGHYLPEN